MRTISSPLKDGFTYQLRKRRAIQIDDENVRFAKSILRQQPRVELRAKLALQYEQQKANLNMISKAGSINIATLVERAGRKMRHVKADSSVTQILPPLSQHETIRSKYV